MAERSEAPAVKANEEDNRVIYAVTDGIASYQTTKKYAYHFRCFVEHFDGITEDSLLSKASKEPKVLSNGSSTFPTKDTIDIQPSIMKLLQYCISLSGMMSD
jgi:hypothetical protein